MDENAPEVAINKMNLLRNDFELYKREREKTFNFFKQHFDSQTVYDAIMKHIEVTNDVCGS
jgi:hypothetical protein